MSYKSPLASTIDFGIVKVGTGLSVTAGTISATLGLENYGFFTDSTTQTNPVASTANITTFNVTGPANGISVVGGTAITVVNAGTYTKLFTVLISKTSGGNSTVSLWLRLNGVDIPGSAQNIVIVGANLTTFTSGNFTLNIPAGGNIQLCWSSADTTVVLLQLPATVAPTRPTGNSVKVTLTRIS